MNNDLLNPTAYNCKTTHTQKYCPKCGLWLDHALFSKDKGATYGLRSHCKKCDSEYQKQRPTSTKIQRREYRLKHAYDITQLEYNQLLEVQGGGCAICGSSTSKRAGTNHLCIDHCHITGEIRGLLCNPCNIAIGLLQDDPDLMLKATEYLSQ